MENNYDKIEKEVLADIKPNYTKSKEDLWLEMEGKLESKPTQQGKIRILALVKYAIAASFALIIGLSFFANLYTEKVQTIAGERKNCVLPDGSKVSLNALTTISFKPYLWFLNRNVTLEGEAFFEVKKGEKFDVISKHGKTIVLGTSFNINTFYNYQVLCKTGKVQVMNLDETFVFLYPGESVEIDGKSNKLSSVGKGLEQQILGWKLDQFVYNNTPLEKVFRDMERQYGVSIEVGSALIKEKQYSGVFKRSIGVEKALEIISFSFGITINKDKNGSYKVIKGRE